MERRKIAFFLFTIVMLFSLVQTPYAAVLAYWQFEDGTAGNTMVGSSSFTVDNPASVDYSGNGNDLYAETAAEMTFVAAPSAIGTIPDTGATNLICVENTEAAGQANVMTRSSLSAPTVNIETAVLSQWTLEVFVNMNSLAEHNTMIGRDGISAVDGQRSALYFKVQSSAGAIQVEYDDAGGVYQNIRSGDGIIEIGNWYYICARCDGTTVEYWVANLTDGETLATKVYEAALATSTNTAMGPQPPAGYGVGWSVLRGMWNSNPVDFSDALIDEVRISDHYMDGADMLVNTPPIAVTFNDPIDLGTIDMGVSNPISMYVSHETGGTIAEVTMLVNGVAVDSDTTPVAGLYEFDWTPPRYGSYTITCRVEEGGTANIIDVDSINVTAVPAVALDSIGLNFQASRGGDTPILRQRMAATDETGVIPQQHWNNTIVDNTGTLNGMCDDSGTTITGITLSYDSGAMWNYFGDNDETDPVRKLYNGFLAINPASSDKNITLDLNGVGAIYDYYTLYAFHGDTGSNQPGIIEVNDNGIEYYGNNTNTHGDYLFKPADLSRDGTYIAVPGLSGDISLEYRRAAGPNSGLYGFQVAQAERVRFTSPAAGNVAGGTAFTLTATATSSIDTITTMEFFNKNISLGFATLNGSNWEMAWDPEPGDYYLLCVATNAAGQTFSSEREYVINVPYYVTHTGAGTGDGSTWANAMSFINAVVAMEDFGGTYYLQVSATAYNPYDATLNSDGQITPARDIAVYGGFAGTEATAADRVEQTDESIITTADQYRIFNLPAMSRSYYFDTIVFYDSNAQSYASGQKDGSAIFAAVRGTCVNCRFDDCDTVGGWGGGVQVYALGPHIFEACTFENCTNDNRGGAVAVKGGAPAIFDSCTFYNNYSSAGWGGAIYETYTAQDALTVVNCIFTSNTAGPWADAGACIRDTDGMTVINNTFVGNGVDFDPGVVHSALWLEENDNTRHEVVLNNIFVDFDMAINTWADVLDNAYVSNNLYEGADGSVDPPNGIYDGLVDPRPVYDAVTFADKANRNYRISGLSPIINAGVADDAAPAVDFDGVTRIGRPDIGAFESLVNYTSANPASIDFGVVTEGTSDTVTLRIGAGGTETTVISSITFAGDSAITMTSPPAMPLTLAAGEGTTMVVSFVPPAAGFRVEYSATVTVVSNSLNTPVEVNIEGTGDTTEIRGERPTCEITLGSNVASPTAALPIAFNVEFSEPVTGLEASEVAWNGTLTSASLTVALNALNQAGTLYEVLVTGVTGATTGTLAPTIPAGVCVSGLGRINYASTGNPSVTYDSTLIGVTLWTDDAPVTDGDVVTYSVTFTEPVDGFSQTLLSLAGTATGAAITTVTETVTDQAYDVAIDTSAASDGSLNLVLEDDDTIIQQTIRNEYPITVENPSFLNQNVNGGNVAVRRGFDWDCVPGWSSPAWRDTGRHDNWRTSSPDGTYDAFIMKDTVGNGGTECYAEQTTEHPIAIGDQYHLTFWNMNLVSSDPYSVTEIMLYAGDASTVVTTQTFACTDGVYAMRTLDFTVPSTATYDGENLGIRVTNVGTQWSIMCVDDFGLSEMGAATSITLVNPSFEDLNGGVALWTSGYDSDVAGWHSPFLTDSGVENSNGYLQNGFDSTIGYMQGYCYQVTDHVIAGGDYYEVSFDTLAGWSADGVWDPESCMVELYAWNTALSTETLISSQTAATGAWANQLTTWTIPASPSYAGDLLGIRFTNIDSTTSGSEYASRSFMGVDNVVMNRVETFVGTAVLNGVGNGDIYGNWTAIDKSDPVITSVTRYDPLVPTYNKTVEEGMTFMVTFSDALTGVDVSDFDATQGGASIASILGFGATYYVSVDPGTALGVLGIELSSTAEAYDMFSRALAGGTPNPNETYFVTETFDPSSVESLWTLFE
ncbi:right-handed parallel beta-helix repeat-containing protein [Candidatus Sumerlaeota bacterium]|nr:right-handed parallel beta-helix repeat-containing protein [Candidatus Sumerlaeota bacterium]